MDLFSELNTPYSSWMTQHASFTSAEGKPIKQHVAKHKPFRVGISQTTALTPKQQIYICSVSVLPAAHVLSPEWFNAVTQTYSSHEFVRQSFAF